MNLREVFKEKEAVCEAFGVPLTMHGCYQRVMSMIAGQHGKTR